MSGKKDDVRPAFLESGIPVKPVYGPEDVEASGGIELLEDGFDEHAGRAVTLDEGDEALWQRCGGGSFGSHASIMPLRRGQRLPRAVTRGS